MMIAAKKYQKGFGAVEIIIIVVVVLLLGAVSFMAIKAVSNKKTEQPQNSNSSQTTKNQGQTKTKKLTPEQKVKFEKVRTNIQESLKKKQIGN